MFASRNKRECVFIFGALIAWFTLYYEVIFSAAQIWYTSEIFTHGFFVVPGALWIIWSKRNQLASVPFSPNYWVLLLLAPVLLLGLLGSAGDINLFRHFACFASLPLAVWMVIGNKAAKVIWFPLVFMLFAIPVGEELVPTLQQWTAKLAIAMLSITSIPVFVDGLYIEIPQGKFVVAEACSGIRFSVGSLVFGVVYAYYSYASIWLRGCFVILAIVVPVVANAGRVFGLVLIGRYFGMEHASGTDHLVYGWFFFAIVLGLLFFVGELLRKLEKVHEHQVDFYKPVHQTMSVHAISIVLALLIAALLWGAVINNHESKRSNLNGVVVAPSLYGKTVKDGWAPLVHSQSDKATLLLRSGVEASVYWFASDQPGAELTDYRNRLFDKERWSIVAEQRVEKSGRTIVRTVLTGSAGAKRLIYSWFVLESGYEVRSSVAKVKQTVSRLLGGSGSAGWVLFTIPYREGGIEKAESALSQEYRAHAEAFEGALPF